MVLVIYPNGTRVESFKTAAHHRTHGYQNPHLVMPLYHKLPLPPKRRGEFTYTQMNKIIQMWEDIMYDSICTVK